MTGAQCQVVVDCKSYMKCSDYMQTHFCHEDSPVRSMIAAMSTSRGSRDGTTDVCRSGVTCDVDINCEPRLGC